MCHNFFVISLQKLNFPGTIVFKCQGVKVRMVSFCLGGINFPVTPVVIWILYVLWPVKKIFIFKPAGMAKWIVHSLVNPAAQDQISLLPKASIHCCLPSTACMRDVQKEGLLYTCLYSVHPLLVEKAGVAPDMTLRFTTGKQESVEAREPSWLWNPWGGSHNIQNRGNQWPHKMELGPTKIKKCIYFYLYLNEVHSYVPLFKFCSIL